MLASRLMMNGRGRLELDLVAYAEALDASGVAVIPSTVLPGDLIVVLGVQHDNGTTTTPGTTTAGAYTGFTTINQAADAGGSDDMNTTFAYKIAVAGDAGASLVGGPTGGDDGLEVIYVFRITSPATATISSASVLANFTQVENTETSIGGTNTFNFTTNFNTSKVGNVVQLLLAVYATQNGSTPLGRTYSIAMNEYSAGLGERVLAYKAYDGRVSSIDSSVTFTLTESGSYYAIGIASLSLTV